MPPNSRGKRRSSISAVLEKLAGMCQTYTMVQRTTTTTCHSQRVGTYTRAGDAWWLVQGWWAYEWCHQTHVRQFHREPDGTVTHDWSLGKFDALSSVR